MKSNLFVGCFLCLLASTSVASQTVRGAEGCVVAGCSSELCVEQSEAETEGRVSTCLYSPTFACYRNARCERQSNHRCGWTKTPQLLRCLNQTAPDLSVPPADSDLRRPPLDAIDRD